MAERSEIVITAVDQTRAAFTSVQRGLADIGGAAGALDGIAARIPVIGTALAAAFGGVSITQFVRQTIDAGDAMNDMAQRTGIAVRDLAAYKLATDQSGTSMDTLSRGIKAMSVQLVENGEAMRALGVTATTPRAALEQFADIFAKLPDGIDKTTLATKVLGKSGQELIPFLNLGGEGLRKSADESARYAAAMSILAPEADRLNDELAKLSLQSQTLGATIAAALAPGLTGMVTWLNDIASGGEKARGALEWLKDGNLGAGAAALARVAEFGQGLRAPRGGVVNPDGSASKQSGWDLIDAKAAPTIPPPRADSAAWDKSLADVQARLKAFYAALGIGDEGGKTPKKSEAERAFESIRKAATEYGVTLDATIAKGDKLTAGETLMARAKEVLGAAQFKQVEGLLKENIAREKVVAGKEAERKLDGELARAADVAAEAAAREIESLEARATAAEADLATWGKSASAIEAETIAHLKNQRARYDGLDGYEAEIAKLDRMIAAHQRLRDAAAGKEFQEGVKRSAEAGEEAWRRSSEQIRQSLIDNIMRGGKSAGELLEDYFRTLVLRPVIEAGVNTVLGALGVGGGTGSGGVLNAVLGGGNLINGAASGLGGTATLGTLISGAGSLIGSGAIGEFGAGLAGSFVGPVQAGSAASIGGAVGAAMPYIGAAYLAYSLLAGKGETRGGQALGYGNAFNGKQNQYIDYGTTLTKFSGPSGGSIAEGQVNQITTGTISGINKLLTDLGSTASIAGFQAGLETSSKGRGGVFSGGTLSTGAAFGETGAGTNYGGDKFERTSARSGNAQQILANYGDDMLQVTIQALQAATDLPANIAGVLRGIDAESLTREQAQTLLDSVVAIDQASDAFQAALDAAPSILDDVAAASRSAFGSWQAGAEVLRDLAEASDGSAASLQTITAAMQARYAQEVQLIRTIDSALAAARDKFASSIERITLDTLDPAGQYAYFEAEAVKARDLLQTVTDPELVSLYSDRLNSAIMSAWSLLSEEQRIAQRDQFVEIVTGAQTLTEDRFGDARQQVIDDRRELYAGIGTAIEAAMQRAADDFADTIRNTPPQVVVIGGGGSPTEITSI